MRILHTADWHLGRRLEGRSRHDEQVAALDEICRIAEEEHADAVVVAGDIFDTYHPPTESESLFYRTMTRLADRGRRGVIVIAGNHDSPDRLLAADPYARSLGIVTIGYPKDIPPLHDAGSDRTSCLESDASFVRVRTPRRGEILSVLALPYPSESRLREAISVAVDDEEQAMIDYNRRIREFMEGIAGRFLPGEPNIIASHLFVHGGEESESERPISIGGAYTVDPTSFPGTAGYVALGHLHRSQEKRGERDIPIRYSGSILQYSFSEAGQKKSVVMLETDGTEYAARTIQLGAGRELRRGAFHGTEEMERFLSECDPSIWLDLSLRVDAPLDPEYISTLRSRHPGIVVIRPEFTLREEVESPIRLEHLSLDEQFRRFVVDRYGEEPHDDVVKLFVELTGEEEGNGSV